MPDRDGRDLRVAVKAWVSAVILIAFVLPAGAQSAPVLHSRGERSASSQSALAKGYSTLPYDASGEYAMDDKGSVAQITIEHNRVTGYITKMEQGTALTLFFDHAAVNGNRVSFATRVVHGLHYSFVGSIVRGDAISPSMDGYYRLTGDLKIMRNGAQETQHVSFKSTPREVGESH